MKLSIQQLKNLLTKPHEKTVRGNIRANCPKCNQDEFYISINVENHPFQCWRKKKCGYSGNIFTLLKDLGKLNLLGEDKVTDTAKKLEGITFIDKEEINLDLPTIQLPLGFKRLSDHQMLQDRCFYSYHKIEFGMSQFHPKLRKDYLIFLIRVKGELKGYVSRNIKSRSEIDLENERRRQQHLRIIKRYINSENDLSKILLGIEECTDNTKTVILVEGIFDKDRVDLLLNLDEQEEIKCCCTFGSSLSDEQIYQLQQAGVENLIILHESDVLNKVKKTASNPSLYFANVKVGYIDTVKIPDPGDMQIEDLENVLLNLEDQSQFLISKVKTNQIV